jgi:hypothetical protein
MSALAATAGTPHIRRACDPAAVRCAELAAAHGRALQQLLLKHAAAIIAGT